MSTADLEKLTRDAGAVCSLIGLAADLASEVNAGDIGRAHVLAALLGALLPQSAALHRQADDLWMAAHHAQQAATKQGDAA